MTSNQFKYKWWALTGLSILSFTAFLDYTIVVTALPFIQKALHTNVVKLQWIVNVFALANAMFMIASGRFGDIFGPRKVFYIGFIFFTIAAIGAGFSQSINWLIAFRILQGISASIILTVGIALLPVVFPEDEQTKAVGIFSSVNGFGLAIGPFVSGILVTYLSWRWVFFINIPFVIVGFACCCFSVKESPHLHDEIHIDWWGLLCLVVGLGCFVFGIISGEQYGWNVAITWVSLIIGAIGLVILFFVESRVKEPLLDLSIFKNRYAMLAALICSSASLMSFVLMFFDPLYLKVILDQSAMLIGILLLAAPLMLMLVSLALGWLERNLGIVKMLILGTITTAIAAVMQAFFHYHTSIWVLVLSFLLMGYIWGAAGSGSIRVVMIATPAKRIGGTMGTIYTFWNLFGAVFLAVTTVLFHAREKIVIHSQLLKHHIVLTNLEKHKIAAMVRNPEGAKSYLTSFVGEKAHAVLHAFNTGFLSAFHGVAWFVAVLMVVTFFLCLVVYPRKKLQASSGV